MATEYQWDKIRKVLEGFRFLPEEKWKQANGELFARNMSGDILHECGACVGAWCAYFLELTPRFADTVDAYWGYTRGKRALKDLIPGIEEVLARHGAGYDPFGSTMWDYAPYFVLRDAIKEITGYDHDEYLRSLPVPPKGRMYHEALTEMP